MRPAETQMNMLSLCLAHDPPKYGRFGDQILRSSNSARARTPNGFCWSRFGRAAGWGN